jgi:rRNA maturation endonuclease Nob1
MDSELFNYMIPVLRCMNCGTEYSLGENACSVCGQELPKPPGEYEEQEKGEAKTLVNST